MGAMRSFAREPTIDSREFCRALGNFVTGVTIVATLDDVDRPRGLTVNSFTSVSLDPPLILVCIATVASSRAAFQRCHGFTVNVLSEEQRPSADMFASKTPDKFDHVLWTPGIGGAPRILGSLAVFDCQIHERVEAGDHLILIGRVVAVDKRSGRPLIYGQGGYISSATPNPSSREALTPISRSSGVSEEFA
jgi:flavin reductase (DIM6/NTAB) family NADH-FMN oxidoreductase RutF